MNFLADKEGYYGRVRRGIFPKSSTNVVEELQNTHCCVLQSEDFKREYDQLLRDYVDALTSIWHTACPRSTVAGFTSSVKT